MTTGIQWTDEAWNPISGCTPISAGCKNCYAERFALRLHGRAGYPKRKPFRVTLHPDKYRRPQGWRKPRRVFVCSMGDLFHKDVSNETIAGIFGLMAAEERHTFQLLTKRPKRAAEWFKWIAEQDIPVAIGEAASGLLGEGGFSSYSYMAPTWPLPNVWLGVTIEDNDQLWRWPALADCPAALYYVSIEPMLSPIEMPLLRGAEWVIVGCESGPGRRPCDRKWARDVVRHCNSEGVPVFVKQLPDENGKLEKMPELFGRVWSQFPQPKVAA